MRQFYHDLDVFVLPSLTEGMPTSVLEAMAMGKAIVTTAVGGIPDMVRRDTDALVVPPNDLASLTEALERVLTSPALRIELGRNARCRVQKKFTAEEMTDRVVSIYEQMLGGAV